VQALDRLRACRRSAPLAAAARIALWGGSAVQGPKPVGADAEERLLALTDGSVACFPGKGTEAPLVVAAGWLEPPPAELLARHRQVVVVRGSTDSPAFRAAVVMTGANGPAGWLS